MKLLRLVKRMQSSYLRLSRAEGDRARRNARLAFLELLRAVRGQLNREFPVEKRRKYKYEAPRPCRTCGAPKAEHELGGAAALFDSHVYTPKPKRTLSVAQRRALEQRKLAARGWAVLVHSDSHTQMAALAGIKLDQRAARGVVEWWGPAWINELPTKFSEHFSKLDLQRARKDAAFRKTMLATLAMKRRQGVIP